MFYTIYFFAAFIFTSDDSAHLDEKDLYRKAYNHLNDSIVKITHVGPKTLAANCSECCVKGVELNFSPELQVAPKFIANNYGFPIIDLAEKKYGLSENCLQSLRMNTRKCEKANKVLDSLDFFWKDYKMNDKTNISKSLERLISSRKDGYLVFFSDVYRNTLAAEVGEFCLPYDKSVWQGSSTIYYFVFSVDGTIEEIYSGATIHYN